MTLKLTYLRNYTADPVANLSTWHWLQKRRPQNSVELKIEQRTL